MEKWMNGEINVIKPSKLTILGLANLFIKSISSKNFLISSSSTLVRVFTATGNLPR